MSDIPDFMPDELRDQEAEDLMQTLQNFCNESRLTPIEIIGALEGVKHAMLRDWFAEDESL